MKTLIFALLLSIPTISYATNEYDRLSWLVTMHDFFPAWVVEEEGMELDYVELERVRGDAFHNSYAEMYVVTVADCPTVYDTFNAIIVYDGNYMGRLVLEDGGSCGIKYILYK